MASSTTATDSSSSAWLIGVVLCGVSSFGTGLSKLAIRKSWLLEQQLDNNIGNNSNADDTRIAASSKHSQLTAAAAAAAAAATRLRYAALFFMTFLNPALDIGAMAFCSPSILAPFSGVSLAWVVLLSNRLVGEQPEKIRVLGACLILVGEVIVAMFGDHSGHNATAHVTLEEVRDSYMDPPFVKFLLLSVILECCFLYVILISTTTSPYWKRFAWGVAGGYITGFQNFVKDAITIVQLSAWSSLLRPWRMPWYFFLLLVMAGATAGGGLAILAACMKRYDATYASGTFAGSLTLAASIMSALHYDTLDHLDTGGSTSRGISSHIMYPTGIGILMAGVGLLMHHSKDAPPSTATRTKEGDGASLLPVHSSTTPTTTETTTANSRTGGALRQRVPPTT